MVTKRLACKTKAVHVAYLATIRKNRKQQKSKPKKTLKGALSQILIPAKAALHCFGGTKEL